MVSLFEYQVFFKATFAYNNYNVLAESFLVCFVEFYFLTQTDDFSKARAHGWRPFLPIFKLVYFKAVFSIIIG